MVTGTASDPPTVGEHVRVRWGLGEVDGVITEVYGSGALARARILVWLKGPNDENLAEEEFSLPFGALIRSVG